eukprot:snap_masked-scaffold_6-processed-gene-8.33-mRNA-1 protein AED:1.00 eAED:1.00 QI:0/0/0/0/1/1/7/0/141
MFARVKSFFEIYKETYSRILSKSRLFVRSVKQGYWPIVGRKLMVSFFEDDVPSRERDISSSLFRPLASKNSSSAICCKISFVIPSGPVGGDILVSSALASEISSSVSMMFSLLLLCASSRYSWNTFTRFLSYFPSSMVMVR